MEANEKVSFGTKVKGLFVGENKKLEPSDLALPLLLVIIIAIFSALSPTFFTVRNFSTFFAQNSHLLIITAAVMIIMISGGCDLSIGWQVALVSIIMATMMTNLGVPIVVTCIVGVLLCALLGTLNGILGIALKSSTMIITLATAAMFKGLAYIIADGKNIDVPTEFTYFASTKIGGVLPISTIIMIVLLIIVSLGMTFSIIGRKVYASGDNPEAARLAGLKVNLVKILAFTCAGVLVGIASCIYASKAISIEVGSVGNSGVEFTGITACVLSGVALKGGEGKLWKVVVATFILAVLENGCLKLSIPAETAGIFKGIIMIASLSLMTFQGGKPAGIRTLFKKNKDKDKKEETKTEDKSVEGENKTSEEISSQNIEEIKPDKKGKKEGKKPKKDKSET